MDTNLLRDGDMTGKEQRVLDWLKDADGGANTIVYKKKSRSGKKPENRIRFRNAYAVEKLRCVNSFNLLTPANKKCARVP